MARPKQKVSITTLAAEFDVTAPTISKALSNSKEVSETLRQKVRARAEELNFIPKRPRRTTFNLCVVMDLPLEASFGLDACHTAIVSGIYNFCQENKLEFSLLCENYNKLDEMDLSKELYRRNADAAIIVRARADRSYLKNLERNHFPYVCVYEGPEDKSIRMDNYAVGKIALDHLASAGHKRVAIARYTGRSAASDRLIGFAQAASQQGMPAEHITEIIPANLEGHAAGHAIVKDWLQKDRPWSAIFCSSDNLAFGIVSEAYLQGIRIPDDLAVITCDDGIHSEQSAPPISVVDIPNRQAGYIAAQYAYKMITSSGEPAPMPAPLAVEQVIARASTASKTT